MVRTGDRCVRVGGGKSSGKKGGGSASSSSSTPTSRGSSSKSNSSIGGNPVCPRETPDWQKPITNFFQRKENDETSNSKPSNVGTSTADVLKIESQDEMKNGSGSSMDNSSVKADDQKPGTSSQAEVTSDNGSVNGNESVCKTPTSERKRKSAINILTPKRIRSNS